MVKKFYFFDSDALKNFHKRIFFSITIFIFVYLIAFYRIIDVMILEKSNVVKINNLDFTERGNIYDRNGYLLSTTIKSFSLSVNPQHVLNKLVLSKKLSPIISIPEEKILKLLNNKNKFIWLKKHLSPREHQKIIDLGEASLITEHTEKEQKKRIYPYANIASHIVGYTNTEGEGLSGIERGLNETLNKGQDIHLSIDINLQEAIREELLFTINKFSSDFGLSIVMDITNGEIISMISIPDFNPNDRKSYNNNNLINRAIESNYEMGSVFKPLTIAMGINKGIIHSDMIFDVSDPVKGIKDFKPFKGSYNVKEIIVNSSNIGTAKIARKIGKQNQKDFFKKIGFNEKVDFEIKEASLPLGNKNNWGDHETMRIGFGYGFAVTPLHLVSAYATLINKGEKNTTTILKDKKKHSHHKVINIETSSFFTKLLRAVILETKFTGPRVKIDGYEIGGKTGTAELLNKFGKYEKNKNRTSFIAVFPVSNPKYLVFTLIENPKKIKEENYSITSATIAAPLVKNIIMKIIEIFNLPSSNSKEILKADTSNYYNITNNVTF